MSNHENESLIGMSSEELRRNATAFSKILRETSWSPEDREVDLYITESGISDSKGRKLVDYYDGGYSLFLGAEGEI
ncbi:hypothetical protein ABES25_09895 [Bacillus gobiensis]|uniref:hypothetical protein n=1 Tax=Bacillus gobiensis TaxID=1441095 RepID=UPI003D2091DF